MTVVAKLRKPANRLNDVTTFSQRARNSHIMTTPLFISICSLHGGVGLTFRAATLTPRLLKGKNNDEDHDDNCCRTHTLSLHGRGRCNRQPRRSQCQRLFRVHRSQRRAYARHRCPLWAANSVALHHTLKSAIRPAAGLGLRHEIITRPGAAAPGLCCLRVTPFSPPDNHRSATANRSPAIGLHRGQLKHPSTLRTLGPR